jgi:glycosyltransferase involved in cell wall biosynthesis
MNQTVIEPKPRVLLTCDWFLKYSAALARGLARAGVPTALLCRSHAFEYGGDQAERARDLEAAQQDGVDVFVLPGRLRDPSGVLVTARLRREIKRWAPDVVHAQDSSDGRFALIFGRRLPVLLTRHDPVPHPGQPAPGIESRAYDSYWYRRAAAVHLHSELLATEFRNPDRKPLYFVPHGISVLDRPLELPASPTILMFGRMEPYKGLGVLAAAMPLIWEESPEVRLLVAGAGTEEFPMPADARVEVRRGYVPERDVRGLFEASTVAVAPYTQASQSGVASLCLGFGVPVVASALGGLPSIVDGAWLCTPGDPADLAAKLSGALSHSADDRRRLLERARSEYSWDAVAQRFLAVYRELLVSA